MTYNMMGDVGKMAAVKQVNKHLWLEPCLKYNIS